MLEVKILKTVEELEETEKISVGYALWGTENLPETYGYLGYIPGKGVCVKMICKEKDPLRTYTKNQDPIWQDSAMEFFVQLSEESAEYMNFEINANGAILAEYGSGRANRISIAEEVIEKIHCNAIISGEEWSIQLLIPETVFESVYGPLKLEKGSTFKCNFYKVCEGRLPGQYGSHAYIPVEKPCFHLPEYFARVVLI